MIIDTLSQKDCELFYRLKHTLYLYANYKLKLLSNCNSWECIGNNDLKKIMKVREYVFIKNNAIIDEFVTKNQFDLNNEELKIISSWKKAINAEKFILYKHTKEHSLFFGNSKVYGIKGLMDSFSVIFDGYAPLFVDLLILPFKDILTHEGLFVPYQISFGRNMRSSIKAEAEETIQKNGIITTLTSPSENKKVSDENMLRYYMKSEQNRNRFWEKIENLKKKSDSLNSVFKYELGRINTKKIKSDIKKQGLKGHFAVLVSQVVATGLNRKELEKNISLMVPNERQKELYLFQTK